MKEILKELDIGDFFRYIGPGSILLLSFVLWKPFLQASLSPAWDSIVTRDLVLSFVVIVGAYTIGLLLESLSTTSYGRLQDHPPGRWYLRLGRWVLATPNKRMSPSIVQMRGRVATELEEISRLGWESELDPLQVYRNVESR